MTAVGRNDPCPCGSGLKYKKCCLGKDQVARAPFSSADRDSALAGLMRFSTRPAFARDHVTAQELFWGDRLAGHPEDRVREVNAHEQSQMAYHDWFVFDYPLGDDRTVVDLFLEREGARLGVGEREYLERMRHSHIRLYEVVEVVSDEGLHLVDLWTDERVWVRERMATRQLVRWDLLAARLMRGAQGDLVMDGAPYLYPAASREPIVKELRRLHRSFARRIPGRDLAAFFKAVGWCSSTSGWTSWPCAPSPPS